MTQPTLAKAYDFKATEVRLYKKWEEGGYFQPANDPRKEGFDPARKPFVISIPPPNVTGELHTGHAMFVSMEDLMIRYHRMQGIPTLWVPGTDHAGIATQMLVEKALAREGLKRDEMGREEFLRRTWEWKEEYGQRITTQIRRLGASCDWTRERFTLDDGLSKAVREAFVRLYEKGLIYRGPRMINWSPALRTAVSDLEVEYSEEPGFLYYFKYMLADGSGDFIPVATTRPETILGDTAVAVHPDDERYKHLVGKQVRVPIIDRLIPVIADPYVTMEFGTGALKITPAHDPNDYAIGMEHGLEMISILDTAARMNEQAGPYQGLDRFECRQKLWEDMRAAGLVIKEQPYTLNVPRSQRGGEIVEPMISTQWFIRIQPLAEKALEAVRDGRTKIVPERFTKIYYNWMENIRDWCISRQLWWGHRIPVWYCQDCGEVICAKEAPQTCPKCRSNRLEQDPDVLDTWFSSGLWPFSTLGWPAETAELKCYYPTSVLVTGRDIIFFWVARMIFSGIEFMPEVPFREVFIHGLILDAQGRKMSKSLGNGIDPLEVIEKYGADTLRFMLITGNTPGNDLRFQVERLESTRNFANKVWNASRFALMNLEDYEQESISAEVLPQAMTLTDRWIRSRFAYAAQEVTRNLDRYDLGEAAHVLYEFIWNELCDWYIEMIKPRLYGKDSAESRKTAQAVLARTLRQTMELLHPFMPFITEEIWQLLPHEGETIMLAAWTKGDRAELDDMAEQQMLSIMEVIKAVRNLRSEMNVPPGKKAELILMVQNETVHEAMLAGAEYIKNLAGIHEITLLPTQPEKPSQAVSAVVSGVELYLPLKGLVDLEKELARLNKEKNNLDKEISRLTGKLNNPAFVDKAPLDVVEKEKLKLRDYEAKKEAVLESIASLR